MIDRRKGQRGVTFDLSINLGNIFALLGLILILWQMNNGVIARLASIEDKVQLMWNTFQLDQKR